MPFLVDGDNLLGTWPGRNRSSEERRILSRTIMHTSRELRRRIVVVFDGPVPGTLPPSTDIHFSGRKRSADDAIIDWLRKERAPREWTVVTSDRVLGDRCRHLGARVERSDLFRRRLRQPTTAEKPAGTVDVDDWVDYFGLDGDHRSR